MITNRNTKKIRATALLLAVLMLALLVAGCNNGGAGEATPAPGTATPATTGGDAPASNEDETGQVSAYGNVALADQLDYINYDSAIPIIKEGSNVTLRIGVQMEPGFPCNVTDNWMWKFTEDKLGITVDVEEILDTEKLRLLFASNQIPDMMLGVAWSTSDLVNYGVLEKQILPYSDYLDTYMPSLQAFFESRPDAAVNYIATDGKMYMFPRVMAGNTIVGSYIHQGWLDKLGLPQPKTLDEFTETMIAFRDAGPEGLGVDRVVPIGGGYNSSWACPAGVLFEAMGYQISPYWQDWDVAAGYEACLRVDDNGVADYGLPVYDEIFADALAVMNNWYNEKLFSSEFFTMDPAQVRADATAGYTGWQNTSEGIGQSEESLAGWRQLAPLTSQWNSTPQCVNYPVYSRSPFSIGAGQYPEVCARFFDVMYNPEWDYVILKGPIEGIHDTYGLPGYVWGLNINGDEAVLIIDGDEVMDTDAKRNNWQNTYYLPTYMDQALQPTFEFTARWKSAVAGKEIAPESKDIHVERQKKQLAEDPEQYKNNIFFIEQYDARGPFSEYGVTQVMRYVYRTPETNQKIADLDAVLSPYIQEQVALFIAGKRPLDEVSKFQEELKAMGIEEYEAILAAEYQAYLSNLN